MIMECQEGCPDGDCHYRALGECVEFDEEGNPLSVLPDILSETECEDQHHLFGENVEWMHHEDECFHIVHECFEHIGSFCEQNHAMVDAGTGPMDSGCDNTGECPFHPPRCDEAGPEWEGPEACDADMEMNPCDAEECDECFHGDDHCAE